MSGSTTQTTEEKKDIVVSLDFDGCFSEKNDSLIDFVEKAKTILVGSNRQTHRIDNDNGVDKKNGSCFPHFKEYGERFHRLLAADIQRQKEPGFTLEQEADKDKFEYIEDGYKRTLIYSQIQAMVELRKKNKQSPDFVFQFVDDKEDILQALKTFFCDNPDFIPEGVTLQLFRYSPEKEISEPEQFDENIHGTGEADANYVNTSNAISKYVETITNLEYPEWIIKWYPNELEIKEALESYKKIVRTQIIQKLGSVEQAQTPKSSEEIKSTHDIKLSEVDEEKIKQAKLYAKTYLQAKTLQAKTGLNAVISNEKNIKLEIHFHEQDGQLIYGGIGPSEETLQEIDEASLKAITQNIARIEKEASDKEQSSTEKLSYIIDRANSIFSCADVRKIAKEQYNSFKESLPKMCGEKNKFTLSKSEDEVIQLSAISHHQVKTQITYTSKASENGNGEPTIHQVTAIYDSIDNSWSIESDDKPELMRALAFPDQDAKEPTVKDFEDQLMALKRSMQDDVVKAGLTPNQDPMYVPEDYEQQEMLNWLKAYRQDGLMQKHFKQLSDLEEKLYSYIDSISGELTLDGKNFAEVLLRDQELLNCCNDEMGNYKVSLSSAQLFKNLYKQIYLGSFSDRLDEPEHYLTHRDSHIDKILAVINKRHPHDLDDDQPKRKKLLCTVKKINETLKSLDELKGTLIYQSQEINKFLKSPKDEQYEQVSGRFKAIYDMYRECGWKKQTLAEVYFSLHKHQKTDEQILTIAHRYLTNFINQYETTPEIKDPQPLTPDNTEAVKKFLNTEDKDQKLDEIVKRRMTEAYQSTPKDIDRIKILTKAIYLASLFQRLNALGSMGNDCIDQISSHRQSLLEQTVDDKALQACEKFLVENENIKVTDKKNIVRIEKIYQAPPTPTATAAEINNTWFSWVSALCCWNSSNTEASSWLAYFASFFNWLPCETQRPTTQQLPNKEKQKGIPVYSSPAPLQQIREDRSVQDQDHQQPDNSWRIQRVLRSIVGQFNFTSPPSRDRQPSRLPNHQETPETFDCIFAERSCYKFNPTNFPIHPRETAVGVYNEIDSHTLESLNPLTIHQLTVFIVFAITQRAANLKDLLLAKDLLAKPLIQEAIISRKETRDFLHDMCLSINDKPKGITIPKVTELDHTFRKELYKSSQIVAMRGQWHYNALESIKDDPKKLAEFFLVPGQQNPNDMGTQLGIGFRPEESGVLAYTTIDGRKIPLEKKNKLRFRENTSCEGLKQKMLKEDGFFGLLDGDDLAQDVRDNMEKFCFEQITTQGISSTARELLQKFDLLQSKTSGLSKLTIAWNDSGNPIEASEENAAPLPPIHKYNLERKGNTIILTTEERYYGAINKQEKHVLYDIDIPDSLKPPVYTKVFEEEDTQHIVKLSSTIKFDFSNTKTDPDISVNQYEVDWHPTLMSYLHAKTDLMKTMSPENVIQGYLKSRKEYISTHLDYLQKESKEYQEKLITNPLDKESLTKLQELNVKLSSLTVEHLSGEYQALIKENKHIILLAKIAAGQLSYQPRIPEENQKETLQEYYQDTLIYLANEDPLTIESMRVITWLTSIFLADNHEDTIELLKEYHNLPKSESNSLNQYCAMIYVMQWNLLSSNQEISQEKIIQSSPTTSQIKLLEPKLRADILHKKIELILEHANDLKKKIHDSEEGRQEDDTGDTPQDQLNVMAAEYQKALLCLTNEGDPNDTMQVIIWLTKIFLAENNEQKYELIQKYHELPKLEQDNPLNQHGAMIYAKEWLALFDLSKNEPTEFTPEELQGCQPTEADINLLEDPLKERIQSALNEIQISLSQTAHNPTQFSPEELLIGAEEPRKHTLVEFFNWIVRLVSIGNAEEPSHTSLLHSSIFADKNTNNTGSLLEEKPNPLLTYDSSHH